MTLYGNIANHSSFNLEKYIAKLPVLKDMNQNNQKHQKQALYEDAENSLNTTYI